MTRKLLVVEVPEGDAHRIMALGYVINVHELPTAEELGRVAMEAYMEYLESTGTPDDEVARPQVGQAILAALTKGAK